MAYASASDLLLRYDSRRVADLVSDAGERSSNPASSPVLAAVLDDASGAIDAACRAAQRYLASDLAGLSGNSLALLKRLTCDLAFSYLVARRGYSANDQRVMAPQAQSASDMLEMLRRGERIFNDTTDAAAAGVTVHTDRTVTSGFYTQLDIVGRSSRLFGERNS